MRLKLKTQVQGYYLNVFEAFDINLFEALKPKGAKMEVVQFTGSKTGDRVHLRFLSPIRTDWVSLITSDDVNERHAYFIDEGIKLPWGLRKWKHKHIVEKIDQRHSYIIDDIQYEGKNMLLSILFWPILYLGFYPRKSIYRAYFAHLFNKIIINP